MSPDVQSFFISVWIKYFFLLTPFFALSMFLLLTGHMEPRRRRMTAVQVTVAVCVVCATLFFIGNPMFSLLGITVDSFRVGAGVLLFLSAVSLVQGNGASRSEGDDVAVVPLAVPVIVGPATMGATLVMGAEIDSVPMRIAGLVAIFLAIVCVGIMLLAAGAIERLVKKRGIAILSKLTGLMVAAIAAQMVLEGARHLLARP
jgi:multiple antibiotic resistance protein